MQQQPRQPVEPSRPHISGAIVLSVRGLLVQDGLWPAVSEVLARDHPERLEELNRLGRWSMVDLDLHVALVDAAAEVLGEEGLRHFGRHRIVGDVSQGWFATIARSWLRSFSSRPDPVLRMIPYLWRSGLRDCGQMIVQESGKGHMRLRLRDPPQQLGRSKAWQMLLSGMAEGVLGLADVQGEARFAVPGDEPGAIDLVCTWAAR
jgi:hypothetical protein